MLLTKAMVSAVLLLLLSVSAVQAQCNEELITSIAGDSITNAYWIKFRDVTSPPLWEVHKVALGGLGAQQFNGELPDKNGELHDYTQDLIDIGPVSTVLLLGTNNAVGGWGEPDHTARFAIYTSTMDTIWNRLEAAGIAVVVGIPTPMYDYDLAHPYFAIGESRLAALYRPWLEAEAFNRGLLIADFNTLFTSQGGWEAWFPDGIHPFTEEGALQMAERAAEDICIQYVPEPSPKLSLLFGSVLLLALLKLRDSP
jgi:hypothetical protein